jgi:DNA polymerase-4
VTLKVKFSDFRQITRAHTSAAALQSRDEFETLADALLATVVPAPRGVRLLGLSLSSFDPTPAETQAAQMSLAI